MNTKINNRYSGILQKSTWLLVGLAFIFISNDACARPHNQREERFESHRPRAVKELPRRHDVVTVGPKRFHYHRGVFYRKTPSGFWPSPAPIGAVIATLPSGFNFIAIGGTKYFHFGGVYYQPAPAGYVVVRPGHEKRFRSVEPRDDRYRVSVTTNTLNIRSGPSRNFEVLDQAVWGEVLDVLDQDDGWLYVRLPNGRTGWTMERFTSVYRRDANG